jgi:hypothetical protein
MDREKRRESYLAQARVADEKAERASDLVVKEAFRRVASGFRALANGTLISPNP